MSLALAPPDRGVSLKPVTVQRGPKSVPEAAAVEARAF